MRMEHPGVEAVAGPWPPVPRVRFGALNEAWGLFARRWRTWVVVSLIVISLNLAIEGAVESAFGVGLVLSGGGYRVSVPEAGRFVHVLLAAVLNGFLLGGMIRLACLQLRGSPAHVADLFGVTEVARELAIGSALYAAGCVVASSFFVLPGLVLAGLWMFAFPLIVDGRYRAVDALGRSWTALKSRWFMATLFNLSAYGLAGLGTLLCGVGLVVTMPLYALAIAVLYRDFHPTLTADAASKPAPPDPDF